MFRSWARRCNSQFPLRMQVVHDVDWIPDYWADDNNWNIPGENTADYIEKLRAGQD